MKLLNIANIPEEGVSHNPEIKKRVILTKGQVPHLMMYGQAKLLPGQVVSEHAHETMDEVFTILAGKSVFVVNGEEHELKAGDTILIEHSEPHSQTNPFDEPVTWYYFGVATD